MAMHVKSNRCFWICILVKLPKILLEFKEIKNNISIEEPFKELIHWRVPFFEIVLKNNNIEQQFTIKCWDCSIDIHELIFIYSFKYLLARSVDLWGMR